MSEDDEEARKTLARDVKRARDFADMMRTPGWKAYEELINYHINARTENLFSPTPAGGEMIEQHNKGACFGLMFARDLPSHTVSAMKQSRPASEEETE